MSVKFHKKIDIRWEFGKSLTPHNLTPFLTHPLLCREERGSRPRKEIKISQGNIGVIPFSFPVHKPSRYIKPPTHSSLSLPTTNQSIHQNPIRNPKTKNPCLWFVALELSSMESKEWEPTITTGACNAKELLEFLLQL